MKNILQWILGATFAITAFAQPTQPINNGRFTGVSHITPGASLIADAGSILTGFPGTGTVISIDASGGTTGLSFTGGPITVSGSLTLGGILAKASGGTGTATPGLIQGSNITISGSWPNQTISSTNPGGTVTSIPDGSTNGVAWTVATRTSIPTFTFSLSAITPTSVNGNAITTGTGTLTLGSNTLTVAGASSINGTFTGTSSGTNTGDQTSVSGNAGTATALATGRTISITGDIAYTSPLFDGTGNVTAAGTLPTVNFNTGSFGSSTAIPVFTVEAKGLITAASTVAVVAPAGTLTGASLASGVTASSLLSAAGGSFGTAAFANTSAFEVPLTFTGGLTRATNAVSIADTAVTPGSYTNANITVDQKGRITAAADGSAGSGTVTHSAGSLTASAIVVGNGSADVKVLASLGTTTTLLHGNAAGLPTFGAVNLATETTGTTAAANGGTGEASYTKGDILVATGSTALAKLPVGTDGQVLTADSSQTTGVKYATVTGSGTVTTTGSPTSGQAAEFTAATVIQGVATSGTGSYAKTTSSTFVTPILGTPTSVTLTNGTGLPVSTGISGLGTGVATFLATPSGANLATALTTALPVSKGGTGATTLTAHGVVIGNGTSAVAITTAGTSGQVLTSNGASADPTFQTATGGIGGSTGGTDKALILSNGTGGATVQASTVTMPSATAFLFNGAGGITSGSNNDITLNAGTGFVQSGMAMDTFTSWSSGAPYGAVRVIHGNDVADGNWGHLFMMDDTTSNGRGGKIVFGTGTNILTGGTVHPFSYIRGNSEGTDFGGLALGTRSSGGTASDRITIDSNGVVTFINSTASTSTSTGGATFAGGVGIAGSINSGGDIFTQTVGKTLNVKSGTNAKSGTFTLSSGVVSVSNTSVTANSVIVASVKTSSGTLGLFSPEIVINPGTGFTATGAITDNSVYNFVIFEVN